MDDRASAWELIITLRDRFGARDVTLAFRSRQALERQLTTIDLDRRRSGALCEIRNEAGEILAFRADRYARYRVKHKSMRPPR